MSRYLIDGKNFWNKLLPKALAQELNGQDQEIPALEEYLYGAAVNLANLGAILAELIEDYRDDLAGRAMVRGVRTVGGNRYAVVEPLDIEQLKQKAKRVKSAQDVAKVLVEIASCYSPDYGSVDHPCHRWCPRWGSCETLQRPAIHSLILHLSQSYALSSSNEVRCA